MSNIVSNPSATALLDEPHVEHGGNGHNPNLAHHFDTPEQQYTSGKLGMWVFLGTELLMFGGLFCAYSVYRHNHPEVFVYAHRYLDKWLGAINTVVLITSSLTMAWGVRASQLNKNKLLIGLLICTLMGGYGFLGIKSIEYNQKWKHHLWFGSDNIFSANYKGHASVEELEHEALNAAHHGAGHVEAEPTEPMERSAAGFVDPNTGTPDEAKIKPAFEAPAGLAPAVAAAGTHHNIVFDQLAKKEQERVATFFNIYFFMTGLHGLHVVIGMSLIFWVLIRCFGPRRRPFVMPAGLASVGPVSALPAAHDGSPLDGVRGHRDPVDLGAVGGVAHVPRQGRSGRRRRFQSGVFHAGRSGGALLASGGFDLDLPVSAAVPHSLIAFTSKPWNLPHIQSTHTRPLTAQALRTFTSRPPSCCWAFSRRCLC